MRSMLRRVRLRAAVACMVLGLAVVAGDLAWATLLVPLSDEDLVETSPFIVLGRVLHIESVERPGRQIVTRITLAVDDTVKGRFAADTIVVTQPGGQVGNRAVYIHGAPEFAVDEQVLLFLRRARDGTLRVNSLALGKYGIADDGRNGRRAVRRVPTTDARDLDDFLVTLRGLRGDAPAETYTPPVADGQSDGRSGSPVTARFTLLGPPQQFAARWFEPDQGQPVLLGLVNSDAALGTARTAAVIAEALGAWTNVSTASLILENAGSTSRARSVAGGVCDDQSKIQFNDPFDEIPNLTGCRGVLAVGGFCTVTETRRVNGRTFLRISEGDATVNDEVGSCLCRENPGRCVSDLVETVAHEVGHVIGLGHSSERANEGDQLLREALMYAFAHHDGRGAALNADDIEGIEMLYPVDIVSDKDKDGVPDGRDRCPWTPPTLVVDGEGCACTEAGSRGCDDGDPCTDDQCDMTNGACIHRSVDCSDGEPCTVDHCEAATGICVNDLKGDSDGDGLCDPIDNCPLQPDADPTDLDGNGVGDVCECGDTFPGRCVPGRGKNKRRCIVEWMATPPPPLNKHGFPSTRMRCTDGDPICDDDDVPGQCTFRVALCINSEDPRLPECEPVALRRLRLKSPKPRRPRDGADSINATSLTRAIDLGEQVLNLCSARLPIVVPTRGERAGSKRLRVWATTQHGKRGKAKLKLTCVPAGR